MEKRQKPKFHGTTAYNDPDGAFIFIYSADWRQFSLPEGMDGILVAPEADNPQTWLSIWKSNLPEPVRGGDVEILREALQQALAELEDFNLASSSEEVIADMIKLEREFTFRQDGQTRRRKMWVLYANRTQVSIAYQGASEEDYQHWLAMANYSFHTLKLPDKIWYAPEKDLIGYRKDRPEQRLEDDMQRGVVPPGWLEPSSAYRLPLVVNPVEAERFDRPVDLEMDPVRFLIQQDKSYRPVRIAEVDAAGNVLDPDVLFQFDVNLAQPSGGRLIFIMRGKTPAHQVRHYQVYLGEQAVIPSSAAPAPLLSVKDGVMHEEQESIEIRTPAGVYYYHKEGAGFASLEDVDGRDWIGYHPGGGSAGEYRGIPNLAHPEGFFHPGGTGCKSAITYQGPLKVTIFSESKDGQWRCAWEIYPNYANLTVLKAANPYWFLYEGTPGGKLDTQNQYMVRSPGKRTPLTESWNEIIPGPKWAYFGLNQEERILFVLQKEDDQTMDSYWPMNEEMTVFGFGRLKLEKFLERKPAHFSIGFAEGRDPQEIEKTIHDVYHEIQIVVGRIETRS